MGEVLRLTLLEKGGLRKEEVIVKELDRGLTAGELATCGAIAGAHRRAGELERVVESNLVDNSKAA